MAGARTGQEAAANDLLTEMSSSLASTITTASADADGYIYKNYYAYYNNNNQPYKKPHLIFPNSEYHC